MSIRADFQAGMEKQLAVWSNHLDALEIKAGTRLNATYEQAYAAWRDALEKLRELKQATNDRWDILKVDAEKAWHAAEAALGLAEAETPVARPARDAATRITQRGMAVVTPEGEPPPAR